MLPLAVRARQGAASPRAALAFALSLAASGCHRESSPGRPSPIRVAAAADLTFAFQDIAKLYEDQTGRSLALSFGSSGQLEEQIAQGAPFDVFAAANAAYVDKAVASGACLGDTKLTYATGELVLFTPPSAPFIPHAVVELADPRVRRIAIANPDHAPYGAAAKQALERAGVLGQTSGKIVLGENVQQALQFAVSGNADVAIVARGLAQRTPGEWATVAPELHDAIAQTLVVCAHGPAGIEAARTFASFLTSPSARSMLAKSGFGLP